MGKCWREGLRYCPRVTMSTPMARTSRSTSRTSSCVSPSPSMSPVLVMAPRDLACSRTRGERAAGGDVAEAARPGADIAEDHDGQRAPVPALADVRARGRFADGVQAELAHPPLEVVVDLARRQPGADPFRVAAPLRDEGQS